MAPGAVADVAAGPEPHAHQLAADVPVKQLDKHDHLLDEDLLAHSYAARLLDVPATWATLRALEEWGAGSPPAEPVAGPSERQR